MIIRKMMQQLQQPELLIVLKGKSQPANHLKAAP